MPKLIPDSRPQRVLVASNLIYTMGSGLHLTAGVLYFTQAVRLPAEQVGLGLGIAGLVAPPAVRLALRHQQARQVVADQSAKGRCPARLRRRAAIVSATGTTIQQR
ncbi:hypothetical protein [Streptomyces sp. STR69]|uniref:hypothetical protein n=1 Tax=Streptomyces sp. STR69 TaxID=1796942 RepID=UPI0021C6FC5E|nr:hypothetical protein [Streptomyces sp. STR69]